MWCVCSLFICKYVIYVLRCLDHCEFPEYLPSYRTLHTLLVRKHTNEIFRVMIYREHNWNSCKVPVWYIHHALNAWRTGCWGTLGAQRNYTKLYYLSIIRNLFWIVPHPYENRWTCIYMRNTFGEILLWFVWRGTRGRSNWIAQLQEMSITISLTFLLQRDLFISFIDTTDAIVLSRMNFVSQKQQCNCAQRVFIRIFLHGTGTAEPLNTEPKKKKQAEKLIRSNYVARIALIEEPHCSVCLKPTVLCPSYLLEMIFGCQRSQNTTTTENTWRCIGSVVSELRWLLPKYERKPIKQSRSMMSWCPRRDRT